MVAELHYQYHYSIRLIIPNVLEGETNPQSKVLTCGTSGTPALAV